MGSKSGDSASNSSKPRLRPNGEQLNEGVANLTHQMNQLKRQIQAERACSVKDKIEKNKKNLEVDVSKLVSVTSRLNVSPTEQSDVSKETSLRTWYPLSKYSGLGQGSGDKDQINAHEVLLSSIIKLPYVEKIPAYTTWIFLERNQRMAEDQSVVGRRRIYYDERGSEALICSDSEEENIEPEEEKHDFTEGEDRILWMVFREHGLDDEVVNTVSQFIGVSPSELQDRFTSLKEKYGEDKQITESGNSGRGRGISLDKSLSAALDSFDNLFCRRCMLFDCRLHGCSQALINPSEKQPYWSEYEDDRKPCSDQCYLRLRAIRSLPDASVASKSQMLGAVPEEEDKFLLEALDYEKSIGLDGGDSHVSVETDQGNATSEPICKSALTKGEESDKPSLVTDEDLNRKRKASEVAAVELDKSLGVPDACQDSSGKKQKKLVDLHSASGDGERVSVDHSSKGKSVNGNDAKVAPTYSTEHQSAKGKGVPGVSEPSSSVGRQKDVSSKSRWKPIEKELYLKGIEIFGKNSCLIARNLLSGLKTCVEVSKHMYDSGATMPNRSVMSSSFLEEQGKPDADYVTAEQEIRTRSRLLRRRGRTRKLKYSWKSAGHPSMWKRIADGKNQSSKQYTPCGCQSTCGKQCSCSENGTCCEKYCGCSRSCKNRFRGCHCAKSQCRSRQCPCFAAGRECDPDVCRNCWVSCGDGSLGEPPKRGDGQCGNMRLLLRQQQRILLSKSDVAGWGAFLKNSVSKNEYLGEYTGELISHREADKRGKIYDRANSSFLFDLNDQYVLDAYRKGDKLKFANHSSNPNCYAKVMLVAGDHRVGIFAKEHIEASEELFYDYRYGPDQAPAWARKPEGSKRDDATASQGRAKKHQSH